MFFMMINLLRVRPTFFNEQMCKFKGTKAMKKINNGLVILEEDVDLAIEYLNFVEQIEPLKLSE